MKVREKNENEFEKIKVRENNERIVYREKEKGKQRKGDRKERR